MASLNLDFYTNTNSVMRVTVPDYDTALNAAQIKAAMDTIIAQSAYIMTKAGSPITIKAAAISNKTTTDIWSS